MRRGPATMAGTRARALTPAERERLGLAWAGPLAQWLEARGSPCASGAPITRRPAGVA